MSHHLTISDIVSGKDPCVPIDNVTKLRQLNLDPCVHITDPTIDLDMKGQLFGAYGCLDHLVDHDGRAVNIKDVLGKYLLICSVSLPVSRCSPVPLYCNSVIATFKELLRDGKDFQMVVVPIIRKPSTSSECDEKAFKSFLNAFPPCLSIPYSAARVRTFLCKYMGLGKGKGYDAAMRAMLLNPCGTILLHHHAPFYFYLYGSEKFPYDKSNLKDYDVEDHALRMRIDPFEQKPKGYTLDHLENEPVSLHKDILQCDPSLVLERFDPTSGEPLSVSELNDRYVGLYLIHNQDFLEDLFAFHQDCISKNLEIEIVVVCSGLIVNPTHVQQSLTEALKLCNVKLWFVFPLDTRVSRRLWRILASQEEEDRFVIFPPNILQRVGELEGKLVVYGFGTSVYPFTRTSIVERRYAAVRSFTLRPSSFIKLQGKKFLIYLDRLQESLNKGARDTWLEQYATGLEQLNCEFVCIPLDAQTSCPDDAMKMPWRIMPDTDPNKDLLVNKIFEVYRLDVPIFLIVDGSGKIASENARGRLEEVGATPSLFDDVLKHDILDGVDNFIFDLY